MILGDFPSFHLLGFGGIFRRSVIPSFRIWGYFPPFRDSAIPSFSIWVDFSPFRDSAVPSFRLLGPVWISLRSSGLLSFSRRRTNKRAKERAKEHAWGEQKILGRSGERVSDKGRAGLCRNLLGNHRLRKCYCSNDAWWRFGITAFFRVFSCHVK